LAGIARQTRNTLTFARAAGASVQIIHKPCFEGKPPAFPKDAEPAMCECLL
jgi:hypothetical protein